ncbi:MAG: hypothetical protein RLZZ584_1279 [Pseudomonadota bacterium]|jgi:hypothetical protein
MIPMIHPHSCRHLARHTALGLVLAITGLSCAAAPAADVPAAVMPAASPAAPAQRAAPAAPAPTASSIARLARGPVPAIRDVLMAQFDRPEARLKVDPVVVEGSHAVADWIQGERGGRALLHRHGDAWTIVLCAGDGLKDPEVLRDAGLEARAAARLSRQLAAAERHLNPEQRARLASFEGIVRMDAQGQQAPAQAKH